MSLLNLKAMAPEVQAHPQTNIGAYYKVNYRYTSMQQLEKYSAESKLV